MLINDPYFAVELLDAPLTPNQIAYLALHQDYSEQFVCEQSLPSEEKCGDIIVKRLLEGNRGHFGPLEHIQFVFNIGYFPHSAVQQLTRHRHCSFDVQSFRYSGERIVEVANNAREIESVVYLRPAGFYADRQGHKIEYTEQEREEDLHIARLLCNHYARRSAKGFSPEHCRSLAPFDTRQHFVVSGNLRSWLHAVDIRFKADAQIEIQAMCELILPHLRTRCPQIMAWYDKNRLNKARLAP